MTKLTGKLTMLPPPADCCQQCAIKHDPAMPHNAQTLFYAFWFTQTHGRSPTWNDAMSHCSPDIKSQWLAHLAKLGIDPNSTNLTGNIKSQADVEHLLKD